MKFMSKIQKRRGSTLALTIIIFAVLMIFATFTLGFMVTENKQAMYYQNKTQAYYYAKSGADIVEKALVDQLRSYGNDSAGVSSYLSTYSTGYSLNLNLNDSVATIAIKYDKVNESAANNVLIIDSEAEFNGVKSSIKKIIYSVVNKISTTNNEIIYEGQGQFLIYKDYGLMHHNQTDEGGEILPPEYGRKATETEANEYGIQHFDPINWDDENFINIDWDNPDESDLNILGLSNYDSENNVIDIGIDNFVLYDNGNSTYGEVGKTTNVYVYGPLDLSSRNL
ncbi:MAG: hypothetical protein NUK57_02285, partial [Gudongella sp.]|nr:hypothetical protein [Gudongella sp.]